MLASNPELINVLREAPRREYEKIDKAEKEIIKLKLDLFDQGVELLVGE